MAKKTCAACDCEPDANAINVTVGGKAVEVCCANRGIRMSYNDHGGLRRV
jgi:hypothetical protein